MSGSMLDFTWHDEPLLRSGEFFGIYQTHVTSLNTCLPLTAANEEQTDTVPCAPLQVLPSDQSIGLTHPTKSFPAPILAPMVAILAK